VDETHTDRYDIGRIVLAALESTLVATSGWVGVRRVKWTVSTLSIRAVRAIASVQSIEEVVQEARSEVDKFIIVVIRLRCVR